MLTAYFDCFSGISGDMLLGAFLDAGLEFTELERHIAGLALSGYEISCKKILKKGISSSSFNVNVIDEQPCRGFTEIADIIMRSSLEKSVKNNAISIFRIIGMAEAKVHHKTLEDVHFHEIGAVDSIIDICGAAIAFHIMGIKRVVSSPLNTGCGYVKTEHGLLPVPAPATAEILKGIPFYANEVEGELVTPTGAAVISFYTGSFSQMPEMKVMNIGYGAGTRELDIPNLLRLYIGYC